MMSKSNENCVELCQCEPSCRTVSLRKVWISGSLLLCGLLVSPACSQSENTESTGNSSSGGAGGAGGSGGGAFESPSERDDCDGRTKFEFEGRVVESYCDFVLDLGNGERGYRCDCDVELCSGAVDGQGGAGGARAIEDLCGLELVSAEGDFLDCRGALQEACGVHTRENGFCDLPYESFTATHEGQQTPPRKTVECIEQADGTHLCDCGSGQEPIESAEEVCLLAAYDACQTPCSNEMGSCTPNGYGYDCSCEAGFEWSTEQSASCEHTLHAACAPGCEENGHACYTGTEEGVFFCTCAGSPDVHEAVGIVDESGDECQSPLRAICGSSSED